MLSGIFDNLHIWAATATVVALQALAIAFPPLARLLALTRLSGPDLAVIITCTVLPIVVVEIYKAWVRTRLRHEPA